MMKALSLAFAVCLFAAATTAQAQPPIRFWNLLMQQPSGAFEQATQPAGGACKSTQDCKENEYCCYPQNNTRVNSRWRVTLHHQADDMRHGARLWGDPLPAVHISWEGSEPCGALSLSDWNTVGAVATSGCARHAVLLRFVDCSQLPIPLTKRGYHMAYDRIVPQHL